MSPKKKIASAINSPAYDLFSKVFLPVSISVMIALLIGIASMMASFKQNQAVMEQKGIALRHSHEELKTWTMINVDKNRGLVSGAINRIVVIETKLQ